MSSTNTEDPALSNAGRSNAKTYSSVTAHIGMAAPSKSQTLPRLSRPVSLTSSQASGKSQVSRKQHSKSDKGTKHNASKLDKAVKVSHQTAVYLRGRDLIYPDAASLARFNTWVSSHIEELDAAEQYVCKTCGHVDFTLCQHSIAAEKQEFVEEPATIVADHLRHHTWSLHPLQALRDAIKLPSFDTHSQSDAALYGFSNSNITDQLIIPDLFSYLVLNMQTSYKVNGVEDRALRLAHTHKLATKWLIKRERDEEAETDQHFSVRVRFTTQRACDNMQNEMLYAERTPARNFALAWLPEFRVSHVLLLLTIVLVLCAPSLTLSVFLWPWKMAYITVTTAFSFLSLLAAFAQGLGTNLFVSASISPNGNTPQYLCVTDGISVRWRNPANAHAVTQFCDFTDWATAGLNEASYLIWETYGDLLQIMQEFRAEHLNGWIRPKLEPYEQMASNYRTDMCMENRVHIAWLQLGDNFTPLTRWGNLQLITRHAISFILRCDGAPTLSLSRVPEVVEAATAQVAEFKTAVLNHHAAAVEIASAQIAELQATALAHRATVCENAQTNIAWMQFVSNFSPLTVWGKTELIYHSSLNSLYRC